MQLSIIIPTLNEEQALPGLLSDLQTLRSAGHQVIVVDGGSRDATIAIAGPLVDTLIHSEPGRARQLNRGARAALGETLWFLHADSRLPADALPALIGRIGQGRPWGRFDVRLSGSAWSFRVIERLMNLRSRLTGIATGDQGIFVRRRAFEDVGGFPEIALMEDIALSRLLRRRSRPLCIGSPRLQTSSRRWEEHGIASTIWLMWRLRLAYALGASPADLAARYR